MLSVTFNRPDSLNSLTPEMVEKLCDVLEAAATDPWCGWCGSAGRPRILRRRGNQRRGSGGSSRIGWRSSISLLVMINRAVPMIVNLPKPVVAVVHGPTAGVGVSLALACDIVLASETAFFLLAFTKIGLMPDGGASALVAASIGRARAMKMALLAERLPANEAFD